MRVTNHELMSSLYHHYSICSPLKLSHYGSNVQQARQLKVGAYSKVQKCFFSFYEHGEKTPGSISSLVRFGLQSIIDGLILTWNTVLVFLILVLMGFIQGKIRYFQIKWTGVWFVNPGWK